MGVALAGLRPVFACLFVDFALVAADQNINPAAPLGYMSGGALSVPIVIRTQQGAGRGNGAQHSQNFGSWLAQVPGLIAVAPATPADALRRRANGRHVGLRQHPSISSGDSDLWVITI
jgi:pyruvate/2-oxoglutarate/acetoin dehydrogenase E1 component